MYYPYLRGRQFELIALREFAQEGDNNKFVMPIIEPVKEAFNSITIAIEKLNSSGVSYALILNPEVGSVSGPDEIFEKTKGLLKGNQNFIPALIVNKNYEWIKQTISEFGFKAVMLICNAATDLTDANIEDLISSNSIRYIVSPENRTLKRKLSGTDKAIIRLDDNFKGQKRNSDYISLPEEKFTEEHLFFREDFYHGFSDYTVVNSDYTEGGAAPYAVAIHLTYEKSNREIWVRHFVSDTNDDQSNIQGKFAEAAKKAVEFLDSKDIHTIASEELRKYYHKQAYPGLGMIKKISIKNHLELVNGILSH